MKIKVNEENRAGLQKHTGQHLPPPSLFHEVRLVLLTNHRQQQHCNRCWCFVWSCGEQDAQVLHYTHISGHKAKWKQNCQTLRWRRGGIHGRTALLQPSGLTILWVRGLGYILSVHRGGNGEITIHLSTKTKRDGLTWRADSMQTRLTVYRCGILEDLNQ